MNEDEIRNPYDVLELPNRRHSTTDEIKVAYRRLARKHHPDMGGDSDVFAETGHAFERLNDPVFLFDLNKWERENEPRRPAASAPPTPDQSAAPTPSQSASPKPRGTKPSGTKPGYREPVFEFQRGTFVPPSPTSDPVHEWAAEAAAHAMDPNVPAASAPPFAAPVPSYEQSPLARVVMAWLRATKWTLLVIVVGDLVRIAIGGGTSKGDMTFKPAEVENWFSGGWVEWGLNVFTITHVPITLLSMALFAPVLTTLWWAPRRLMGPIGWREYLLAMVTLVAVWTVWHHSFVDWLLPVLILGWHVVTAVRLLFGVFRDGVTGARTATPA